MADDAWRCSQCGPINEAAASSCRTCGKWPSLFDLQDSVVGGAAPDPPRLGPGETEPYVPETFEPEVLQTQTFEAEPFEPEVDAVPEGEQEGGRRARWTSAIVPLALLVYLAISFFFSDR